jgi:putative membrane protein insertion efficiency factor
MRICITILLIISSSVLSFSQSAEELKLLKEHSCCNHHSAVRYKLTDANGGFANTLFVLYKVFLSSQDHQSCVFTPSCSEYALQSIKKQGFIRGVIDTFDRLTRCNGFSIENYPIDPKTNLLIDPVRDIHYEEP